MHIRRPPPMSILHGADDGEPGAAVWGRYRKGPRSLAAGQPLGELSDYLDGHFGRLFIERVSDVVFARPPTGRPTLAVVLRRGGRSPTKPRHVGAPER